jgi:hypothetical protein
VEEEAAMRSGDDRELLTWSEIGEQEMGFWVERENVDFEIDFSETSNWSLVCYSSDSFIP